MNLTNKLLNHLRLINLVILFLCVSACSHKSDPSALRVLVYDSFLGEGGIAETVKAQFEKQSSQKVHFITAGDAGQIVARLKLDEELQKKSYDVVVGLDSLNFVRVSEYFTEVSGDYLKEFFVDPRFLPIDYGEFAWIVDTKKLPKDKWPKRWSELIEREDLKKQLLLQDPRTSTPGLQFLMAVRFFVLGDPSFEQFWKKLRPLWLTLAPGWSSSYQLFLKQKGTLVWSYTTSQAYHESEGQNQYQAMVLGEGMPVQVEGAAVLKGLTPEKQKLAQDFLKILLSKEVQTKIPQTQWMFPVRAGVHVPDSFKKLPRSQRRFILKPQPNEIERTLQLWNRIVRDL